MIIITMMMMMMVMMMMIIIIIIMQRAFAFRIYSKVMYSDRPNILSVDEVRFVERFHFQETPYLRSPHA